MRLLLIDDHRVFTELLSMALVAHDPAAEVAVAATLSEGLTRIRREAIDAAIVDVQLPDGSGLTAVRVLTEEQPRCRSIVLTAFPRADLAQRALAAGAAAFLAKDGNLDEVLRALTSADASAPLVAAAVRSGAAEEPVVALTPREHEVIALLEAGHSATVIAAMLGLSIHTVRDHISALLGKLGATSQLGAVARATRLGLLPRAEP